MLHSVSVDECYSKQGRLEPTFIGKGGVSIELPEYAIFIFPFYKIAPNFFFCTLDI